MLGPGTDARISHPGEEIRLGQWRPRAVHHPHEHLGPEDGIEQLAVHGDQVGVVGLRGVGGERPVLALNHVGAVDGRLHQLIRGDTDKAVGDPVRQVHPTVLGQLDEPASVPMLFGRQEGRIAKANRGKDPLYLFAALQRQLGYPAVPRPRTGKDLKLPPHLELRLQRVEKRIHLLEAETKGELDLSEFYAHPRPFEDPPHDPLT